MFKGIRRLVNRPDFRRNPAKAVWKRLYWRLRWGLSSDPWLLKLSAVGVELEAPRLGSAALIYYQGFSEPSVARFLMKFLKPGMVFVDIGAHLCEFSLIAARLVGDNGHVYAFEPNPQMARVLQRNVERNHLSNVTVYTAAVGDHDGHVNFVVFPDEPSLSSIITEPREAQGVRMTVPCVCLDTWCRTINREIHLIKVDVEGAELLVLRGSEHLLRLPASEAPVWIIEWSPANWSRFGYTVDDIFRYITQFDYQICTGNVNGALVPADYDSLGTLPCTLDGNVIAAKERLQ